MKYKNIDLKNIAILGLGKSGKAMVNFCIKNNINCIAIDISTKSDMLKYKKSITNKAAIILGDEFDPILYNNVDLVVVSPGVPPSFEPYKTAIDLGLNIVGDFIFSTYFIKGHYICITGTNGKTTTTQLVYEIFHKAMPNETYLAGNIGFPLIDLYGKTTSSDYIICELSSYQIEIISDFKPDIAAILNITPDHMNRYNNFNEYANAKYNLLTNLDSTSFIILNETLKIPAKYKITNCYYFGKKTYTNGITIDDSHYTIFKNNHIEYKGALNTNTNMLGLHNKENIVAAIIISFLSNISPEIFENVIISFTPPKYRLEFKGLVNSRKVYNDSKSTTVDSVVAAVNAFNEDIILMVGGQDKKTDFTLINSLLSKSNLKNIVVFGEARDRIIQDIESQYKDKIVRVDKFNLDAIIKTAFQVSRVNDVILFSPGCASFDMFENYKDRGKQFDDTIISWKKQVIL